MNWPHKTIRCHLYEVLESGKQSIVKKQVVVPGWHCGVGWEGATFPDDGNTLSLIEQGWMCAFFKTYSSGHT